MTSMTFLDFNESMLLDELERLPVRLRAAFAAASAERQFPAYARYHEVTREGDPDRLAHALHSLWNDLDLDSLDRKLLESELNKCMSLLAGEDHGVPEEQLYASDAVASVVYAIRARLTTDRRNAMWAARRAFDAADQYVLNRLKPTIIDRRVHAAVIAHPVVQAELRRQQADLMQLRSAAGSVEMERRAIVELRQRAQRDGTGFFDLTVM